MRTVGIGLLSVSVRIAFALDIVVECVRKNTGLHMLYNARANFLHFDGRRWQALFLILKHVRVVATLVKHAVCASVQSAIMSSIAVRGVSRNIGGHISSSVLCYKWIKMIPSGSTSAEVCSVPQTYYFLYCCKTFFGVRPPCRGSWGCRR